MRNRISNHYQEATEISYLLNRAELDRDYVIAMHRVLGKLPRELINVMLQANTVLSKVEQKRGGG